MTPCSPKRQVHPRACGERGDEFETLDAVIGSSPRVRGTVPPKTSILGTVRFIPARAGNGGTGRSRGSAAPVHPRACGERAPASSSPEPPAGSSPRVRGTVGFRLLLAGRHRFIPARAGNGGSRSPMSWARTVHPRACGERRRARYNSRFNSGSSPRVRGTGCRRDNNRPQHRFIPARAGNGDRRSSPGIAPTVHPRACGERDAFVDERVGGTGSSPRVRGTGLALDLWSEDGRFIPARAGNGTTARCRMR